MNPWTALAEQLDADITEPGHGAASMFAASMSARVDPAAVRTLPVIALILDGDAAIPALWAREDPCPDLATLLTWGEELETHLHDLLKRCVDLGTAARAEHDAAVKTHTAALAVLRRAQSRGDVQDADVRQAENTAAAAARVIADTEAALDQLADTDGRLRYTADLARAIPAAAADVYENVLNGPALPHSGDFITPDDTAFAPAGG